MLSSISQYIRMLDGRDRGCVLDVNREIALELIERKQAIGVEDITSKDALEPWDAARLTAFLKSAGAQPSELLGVETLEVKLPIASVDAVAGRTESGEVAIPRSEIEISTPRNKNKRR